MKLQLLLWLDLTLMMAIAFGQEEEDEGGSWGRIFSSGLLPIDQAALFKGVFDPTNVAISVSQNLIGFVAGSLGMVAVSAVANAAGGSSSETTGSRQFEGGAKDWNRSELVRLLPSSGGSAWKATKKIMKRRRRTKKAKREARGQFDVSQVVLILRMLADAAARFERFIDEL